VYLGKKLNQIQWVTYSTWWT